MRGIFWNSRGLKDLAKRRFLADASIEHQLDFIALSETGRDNFTPQFLSTLSRVSISTGIAYLQEEGPVGSYLGLSVIRWKFGVWSR